MRSDSTGAVLRGTLSVCQSTLALVFAVAMTSCVWAPREELRWRTTYDGVGRATLILEQPLEWVGNGFVQRTRLRRWKTIGLPDDVNIIDVAISRRGLLAVLTHDRVYVYDNAMDSLLSSWGTVGRGPGELQRPVGLTWMGPYVVLLQGLSGSATLAIYDGMTGSVIKAGGSPTPKGDWLSYEARGPALFQDYPSGSGPEDWSRRIGPWDSSSFLLHIQEGESGQGTSTDGIEKPPLELTLVDSNLSKSQVLVDLPSPPSMMWHQGDERRPRSYWERLFVKRSTWGRGSTWLATASAGDTTATVKYNDHGELLIAWPRGSRIVSKADMKYTSAHASAYVNRTRIRATQRTRRSAGELTRAFMRFFQFADSTPEATALLAAGNCLLIAPFAPRDFIDGTATSWLRIWGRGSATMSDAVFLGETDVRVYTADHAGIYGRTYGSRDEPRLTKWLLPDGKCE